MYSRVYRLDIILLDSFRLSGVWTTKGRVETTKTCDESNKVKLMSNNDWSPPLAPPPTPQAVRALNSLPPKNC